MQRHSPVRTLNERQGAVQASGNPIHKSRRVANSGRQEHHANMFRKQRKRQFPDDSPLRLVKIVKLIHHHRADIRKIVSFGMKKPIEQHLGNHHFYGRVGIDGAMAGDKADALAIHSPALDGVLQLNQFLVGQGDERRGVIDMFSGAKPFENRRLGNKRFAGARRRRKQYSAITRGPGVQRFFLHRIRRVRQAFEIVENNLVARQHRQSLAEREKVRLPPKCSPHLRALWS